MSGSGAGRRRLRVVLLAGLVGIVTAPLGWVISDRLESDNDFCTSCHLTPDVPLHIGIRKDFDTLPSPSLASFHAGAGVYGRSATVGAGGAAPFRCIDCHGGTSWVGRARVKALAAKDAFWYALGRYDEPTEMQWPIWDEDCRKCHGEFDPTVSQEWETPRFHELPVHNAELVVNCVECHFVHGTGGNPKAFFIQADRVRTQCARCHDGYDDV